MAHLTVTAAQVILNENFAPWVLESGLRVTATGQQSAVLEIPQAAILQRVGGIMCGQALAAGADSAMVVAIATAFATFKPVATVDMTINFMRPVTGAGARLEASVMRLGKTLAFCRCEITGSDDAKPAGFATGTYAIV